MSETQPKNRQTSAEVTEVFSQYELPPIPPAEGALTNSGGSTIVSGGNLQSQNYSTNSGFSMQPNGDAIFNNLTARGRLTVTAGGVVGGFDIGDDYLRDTGNAFGLASTVTVGDDVRFWAGDTFANRATAPFRITEAGVVTATSGTIGAWNITATVLRSGVSDAASNVLLNPTNSLLRLGPTTGNYITLDGANLRIRSSNYQTGTTGFTIEPTLIEAENIIARGTLRGTTFAYDVVSAIGGQLMVTNADTLASDMTALDASTLTTKGDTTFAVNDILLMRGVATSGIQEEWMRVTNIASAPTYTVTRDIKGDFTANNNPVWKAGTPVVKQGKSDGASTYSGGWLRLIGEGTNSPYYSVFSRTGVAYNSYTEAVRLGNLNGIGSFATETYGLFIGDYSAGQYLTYDTASNQLVLVGSFSVNSNYTAASAITAGNVVEQGSVASEVQRQTIDDTSLTSLIDLSTLSGWTTNAPVASCQVNASTFITIYNTSSAGTMNVTSFRLHQDSRTFKKARIYTVTDARTPYYIYGMVRIASDKVLVCYDGNNAGTTNIFARVITVASDGQLTITAATNTGLASAGSDGKLVRMADNKVCLSVCRSGDFRLMGIVMTISGTTITAGTAVDISAGGTFYDMVLYDTDKLLISHTDTVTPISVSGTVITGGTAASTGTDTRGRLAKISTTKCLFAYDLLSGGNRTGRVRIINLASNVATAATSYEFESTTFEGNSQFPLYVGNSRALVMYKKESANDVNFYGRYIDIDSSDVITIGSIFIIDYQADVPYNFYIQDTNFDYDSGFDFLLLTETSKLTSGFFRASKKSLGVAPTSVSASATLNLVNKGLITGLSGYTVGQQIRDKFNNNVIAVAKTTTSINVI